MRRLYTAYAVLKCLVGVVLALPLLALLVFWKRGFIGAMTFLWPHLDICTPTGKLYLRRWFLTPKTKWFHPWFLHLILLSDEGRDPHDHPGAFTTTILWNGYDEEIYFPYGEMAIDDEWFPRRVPVSDGRPGNPRVREVREGNTYENPTDHTHRVKLIGPTLTLVKGWIRGRRWGFWIMDPKDPKRDRWVDSDAYGEKGVEVKSWTINGK